MDMELVLEELEQEDRRERAAAHGRLPDQAESTPAEGTACLREALAALQRAREDAVFAQLIPDGHARLARIEREIGVLLDELLARHVEDMPMTPPC